MDSIDLQSKLLSIRNKEKNVLDQAYKILSIEEAINKFDFDKLESKNIFHVSHIRNICIDYRLRFLDLNRFKGTIPDEAHEKINSLEKLHKTQIKDFKIMAPSKLFKLDSTDDPLLFAPLGNDYYYLVHKWGNDMSPIRKTLVWPFKNIVNMCVSLILISLVLTWLLPLNLFNPNPTMSDFLLVFLFVFKSIAAVAIFYGFALGKNFNRAIWDSRYYNS
ncbi:MAG: hypothetical protein ISP68_04585 [Flavobacteriaceae bacterium]|nr:hypothetical protein [Flavobacteriaceae bacterium]